MVLSVLTSSRSSIFSRCRAERPSRIRFGRFAIDHPVQARRAVVKYEVIIYWSEDDGAFIAEVPELPGCMADRATKADALFAVEVIAQQWI